MEPAGSVKLSTKVGYGVGHVLNDLTASMWFTYLLLFLHKVVEFNNTYAGVLLFIGQIADGISTVFVGISSDGGDAFFLCQKFGRRKAWHLFGTVCVLLTFPFIFLQCVGCQDSDQYAQMIYYSGFVIIFQFGWAAIQISHLALIPELTDSSDQRSGLTAIRNAASVLSNISVYLVAWFFLGIRERPFDDDLISKDDAAAFRNIVLVVLGIGAACTIVFHILVPRDNEPNRVLSNPLPEGGQSQTLKLSVRQWLSLPQLYQVAVVYLATRLFVNLSQAYIPLFLQVTLRLPATSIAKVPLVMFLSGLVTSIVLERTKHFASRKVIFPIGSFIGIVACAWIFFGCQDAICLPTSSYATKQMYGIAAMIGSSSSIMLVASLSLTADFIGPDTSSAAFIYGLMGLTDKVCNGVAVVLIQKFIPQFTDQCTDCRNYFRSVLVWGLGAACLVGLLALLSMIGTNVSNRRNVRQVRHIVDDQGGSLQEEPTERTSLLASASA